MSYLLDACRSRQYGFDLVPHPRDSNPGLPDHGLNLHTTKTARLWDPLKNSHLLRLELFQYHLWTSLGISHLNPSPLHYILLSKDFSSFLVWFVFLFSFFYIPHSAALFPWLDFSLFGLFHTIYILHVLRGFHSESQLSGLIITSVLSLCYKNTLQAPGGSKKELPVAILQDLG